MRFSQRKGLKPIKKTIQTDFIDQDLRTSLWNILIKFYWYDLGKEVNIDGALGAKGRLFISDLWMDYFKKPLDTISLKLNDVYTKIREYFFKAPWYEVYDFLEFTVTHYPDEEFKSEFIKICNQILERELSGYRFVGDKIIQITSDEEISAIEEALDIPDRFKGPKTQIKLALDKLSDRKSPDYRGSIKDSISAVEGVIRIITRESSLKEGLKKIEEKGKIKLHPALKEAFIKLYGYTCDAEGIRHALLNESNLTFADAKFMLVSCSAFINYLIDKTK